jgi:hypothetical protein
LKIIFPTKLFIVKKGGDEKPENYFNKNKKKMTLQKIIWRHPNKSLMKKLQTDFYHQKEKG